MTANRIVITGSAALAACGVLAMAPPAVQASPAPVPAWTQQAPAASPSARQNAAMAYDAATGTVVLFGGFHNRLGDLLQLGDTWTWDGTTWTKQAPAVHPSARAGAAMAYDPATGTVVLFGGLGRNGWLGDTWTWNGTTWTKQAPATSPPPRGYASMAYDAATGTVVMFGGFNNRRGGGASLFDGTWTWDGTTWTRQAPATSPRARFDATMAYDPATGTAVLFGGEGNGKLGDTWTWDGTTWTQQAPATSPPAREDASMAYDAATGNVVLFGGAGGSTLQALADTWTWDGTTWTKQHPATSPPARQNAAMAYDAATGTVVLFGGAGLDDTWTWR